MNHFLCRVVMSLLSVSTVSTSLSATIVERYNAVSVKVPIVQLASKSLQVSVDKTYANWTEQDHLDSHRMLQKIVSIWKMNNISQYLIYGKLRRNSELGFNWEAVPYRKTSTIVDRIWQQFLVLWKICFGGVRISTEQQKLQTQNLRQLFENLQESSKQADALVNVDDAFCRSEVIEKQQVLEGKEVRVLYTQAPIGFFGERLHFLIVPKLHRKDFFTLTCDEYVEASLLTKKLITHFYDNRDTQEVYCFHKTGKDAGQSVLHWHMHVIMTSTAAQNVFGKLTVLKNMLFGSSKIEEEALREKITSLREELKYMEAISFQDH